MEELKVTCIMPTAGRPEFVPRAIACFNMQSYQNRELVVYDDGDAPRSYVCNDPRIRFFHRRQGAEKTVGMLRNICCDLAQGELIAHWDDDDYSHPARLSDQVALLTRARDLDAFCSVAGYNNLAFIDERAGGQAWLYSAHSHHYAPGTTLLYRKQYWHANPFQDIDVAEDNRFIDEHPVATRPSFTSCADGSWFAAMVARIHGKMTAPKAFAGDHWSPIAAADQVAKMKELLK